MGGLSPLGLNFWQTRLIKLGILILFIHNQGITERASMYTQSHLHSHPSRSHTHTGRSDWTTLTLWPPELPEGPVRFLLLLTLVPLPRSPKARVPLTPSWEQALCPRLEGRLAGNTKKLQPSSQGSSFLASQPVLLAPWAPEQEATQKSRPGNKAALSLGPGLSWALGERKRDERVPWTTRSGEKLAPGEEQVPRQPAKLKSSSWCAHWPCCSPSPESTFSGALVSQNPLSTWHWP